MKSKAASVPILLLLIMLLFSCSSEPEHEHTFSHEWTYDNEYHWHEPTCGHDVVSGKAEHSWDDGEITTQPTHTSDGIRTYTCTVCEATKTEVIPADENAHTYATEWTTDATYHWHAATCGHDVISGKAEHSWDDGVIITEPSLEEDGVVLYTCTECGETKEETITLHVDGYYSISDDGVLYINNKTSISGAIVIPSTVCEITVISLSSGAFEGCTDLTGITIPNTVTAIGQSAFSGCIGLSSITIPASVTSIGNNAFSGCNPQTFVNNSDVSVAYSFSNTTFIGLGCPTTLSISTIYSSVEYRALYNCSEVTSITIPSTVTSIGNEAFLGCNPSVFVNNSSVPIAYAFDSSIYSTLSCPHNLTISPLYTSILNETFKNSSTLESITIPSTITAIGTSVFESCENLSSVSIPGSVESIGSSSFKGCSNLTGITIPNSVLSIGPSAFEGCSGLTGITIPSSVTSIGDAAFKGCSGMSNVTIPNTITSIGESTFEDCSGLTGITLLSSITRIEDQAFKKCSNLTSISIPNTVTYIGEEAFAGCYRASSITIPSSVKSIGYNAFAGCNPTTYVNNADLLSPYESNFGYGAWVLMGSPSEVTVSRLYNWIPPYAFKNKTGPESIILPDSITDIESDAFLGCTDLTSIVFSTALAYIDEYGFEGCTSLAYIGFSGTVEQCAQCGLPSYPWSSWGVPATVIHCSNGDVDL